MIINRILPHITSLMLLMSCCCLPLFAVDNVERETLRFNDAATKAQITLDRLILEQRYKCILALCRLANGRERSKDVEGATAAWRAVLSLYQEHVEARAFFVEAGTLEKVLAELNAKPTDLLGKEVVK